MWRDLSCFNDDVDVRTTSAAYTEFVTLVNKAIVKPVTAVFPKAYKVCNNGLNWNCKSRNVVLKKYPGVLKVWVFFFFSLLRAL